MDTNKVINISEFFSGCHSIKNLPDISLWKMENIQFVDGIFINCLSLLSLPDISKWNIKNIVNIDNIFKGCSSLLSFPDISNWHFHNITDENINNIPIEQPSSSNYSSIKDNKNYIDSYNINSSSFLNNKEKSDFNNMNEYKIEDVTFFQEDNSLTLFYENFYKD